MSIDWIINPFADFIRAHLSSISVGLVATVLVIYGNAINGFFRKLTKKMHFFARFSLFILLCSAGYGFLSSQAVKVVASVMRNLNNTQIVLAVVLAFIVLGFLARAGKEV